MSDIEILLNRGNKDRRQDNFYIEFFNMDENVSNYLGRQVKSITRPQISVENFFHRTKRNQYVTPAQARFTEITVTLADDEEAITSMLLYAQLMRQQFLYDAMIDDFLDGEGTYKEGRFGIKYGLYNSNREETEGYILSDCIIVSITHDDMIASGGEVRNTIQVGVAFDNIQLKVFDRFIDAVSGKSGSQLLV